MPKSLKKTCLFFLFRVQKYKFWADSLKFAQTCVLTSSTFRSSVTVPTFHCQIIHLLTCRIRESVHFSSSIAGIEAWGLQRRAYWYEALQETVYICRTKRWKYYSTLFFFICKSLTLMLKITANSKMFDIEWCVGCNVWCTLCDLLLKVSWTPPTSWLIKKIKNNI